MGNHRLGQSLREQMEKDADMALNRKKEIEALLDQHPSISQSIVLAREDDPGVKRLVAYFVSDADHVPEIGAVHAFLAEKLP